MIASEIDNVPSGLLALLDQAETIASKLLNTQMQLLEAANEEEEEKKHDSRSRPRKLKNLQISSGNGRGSKRKRGRV